MKLPLQFKLSIWSAFFLLATSFSALAQTEGTINKLDFTGIKKTKPSFLNRIVKVKVGSQLDSLKIKTDIERLKRLDGVAYATFKVEADGANYAVTYDIKENFSIIPGARIGQANDGSFSFRVSAFEFNGLGRNITFGGFYQREVFDGFGVFLNHPYLFTNKLGLGVNYQDVTTQQPIFFFDRTGDDVVKTQTNYTFTRTGPEVILFYEKDFNNRFEFGVRYFKDEYQVIEGDEDNILIDGLSDKPEPEANQLQTRLSYEYVDIDLTYQYTEGFRNRLEGSYFFGTEGLLQTEYLLNNTTQYFKRLGTSGNLATQLQIQYSNPISSEFTPLTIDNQLNTRGSGNTIDRGTAVFALNTEYRHTLYEKNWFVLQGNSFVDVSAVRRPGLDFDQLIEEEKLRIYPGVGVRFIHKRIFNAVVRLDYGFNVFGNGDAGGLVFGIGQYF